MGNSSEPNLRTKLSDSASTATQRAETHVQELAQLVQELEEASGKSYLPPLQGLSSEHENKLLQVRLGIASSLFLSLRCKHEPTAQHSLRVTLGCSAWGQRLGISDTARDELELGALLHDVGKIGVPDFILMKPASLTPQEVAVMNLHWKMGREILRASCATPGVLEIQQYAPAWFDGSKHGLDFSGEKIPLGARMLAIADAFDSMITEQVYRRAMSWERAFHELYRNAGKQFDPELVKSFVEFQTLDQAQCQRQVAREWLRSLSPEAVHSHWRANVEDGNTEPLPPHVLFQQQLVDMMFDAVVFIDANLRILRWNRGAERLTGFQEAALFQKMWTPNLLKLQDEKGQSITDEHCPIINTVRGGSQWVRRLMIQGRRGNHVSVDAHAIPVIGPDGITLGVTLLLHDASDQITLEERCQSLREIATKDPLTQVANRAEFDRFLGEFVAAHQESNRPCGMIICDIDRFKSINDTYGHLAGDQVIQNIAKLLFRSCRTGDLTARYGGEEFVVLCADCDNAGAARRAEEIRKNFSLMKHTEIPGKSITASFGVTELQPGDTPETMLRRADRALLMAKESGRNLVIQLGCGDGPENTPTSRWFGRRAIQTDALIETDLFTQTPFKVSLDKLRGFMMDHHAEAVVHQENYLQLKFEGEEVPLLRRSNDLRVALVMDLRFEEEQASTDVNLESSKAVIPKTRFHVIIRPFNVRERRLPTVEQQARQLLTSFKSYLMAEETAAEPTSNPILRMRDLIIPWLKK